MRIAIELYNPETNEVIHRFYFSSKKEFEKFLKEYREGRYKNYEWRKVGNKRKIVRPIAYILHERFIDKAKKFAVKWNAENVRNFITGCLDDGGVPMFKDRYAGKPFLVNGKRAVLGICYGGKGRFKDSQWFIDVPKKDIDLIEKETGEWREFIERYD